MSVKHTVKIITLGSALFFSAPVIFGMAAYAGQNPQTQNQFSQNNGHTVPMNTPSPNQLPLNVPKQQLGMMNAQQAKQIALQHAGFHDNQISSLRIEQEMDDGRMEFEVDFKSGDYDYEYKINGNTGQILFHSFEKRRLNLLGVFKSSTPDNLIQSDYAVQTALNHAGLKQQDVVMGKFSYDFDDGEHIYEIGFYKNYIEYQYEIDAETGEIYKCEVDYHI